MRNTSIINNDDDFIYDDEFYPNEFYPKKLQQLQQKC